MEKKLKEGDICPECRSGNMQIEEEDMIGLDYLICDGLVDPDDPNKELQPCMFTQFDDL